MNKDQLWAKFCEINPSLGNPNGDKVPMTPAQIKKMVETTWKYAHEEGFTSGRKVASELFNLVNKNGGKNSTGNSGADIFGDIFKKKG